MYLNEATEANFIALRDKLGAIPAKVLNGNKKWYTYSEIEQELGVHLTHGVEGSVEWKAYVQDRKTLIKEFNQFVQDTSTNKAHFVQLVPEHDKKAADGEYPYKLRAKKADGLNQVILDKKLGRVASAASSIGDTVEMLEEKNTVGTGMRKQFSGIKGFSKALGGFAEVMVKLAKAKQGDEMAKLGNSGAAGALPSPEDK